MSTETQDTPEQGNPRRKRLLLGLLAVIVIGGGASFAWQQLVGQWSEGTDDAYIGGNVVQITPQTVGTVTRIGADDGDLVQEGQELVSFDPADAEVGLQRAEANLAHTVRQVRGLYNSVDGYRAEVAAREVAMEKARADFARRRNLAKDGAISQEELAHARDALESARSALTSAQQQLKSSSALVDDTVIASTPR